MDIRPLLVILSVCGQMEAMTVDTDYGGLPLQINQFLGEPPVFTLRNRVNLSWSWMVRDQNHFVKCDSAIVAWSSFLKVFLPEHTTFSFRVAWPLDLMLNPFLIPLTNWPWLILDQKLQLLSQGLDSRSLFNLTKLANLFMSHNNLTEVPAGLLDGLKLRLAYNQIEKIGPGAFKNLQNLTLLQGNLLKTTRETDFQGMA